MRRLGPAGRLAAGFIDSRLTPLLALAAVLLGVYAVVVLPREEEPQIVVPMIDVFVAMPGAAAAEVEQRVTRPLEQLLWEIPGVEYVYSTTTAGQSMVILRFRVGENEPAAIVRLNQKIAAHMDLIPPGALTPIVKPRSIDDVPIMAFTLWGDNWDDFGLRRIAAQLREEIKQLPDVSEITIIGGRPRQLSVTLDPSRLAARDIDPLQLREALRTGNTRVRSGSLVSGNDTTIVDSGAWATLVDDIRHIPVGPAVSGVRVADVANVEATAAEATAYVSHHGRDGRAYAAVTVAVAKRAGANATTVTRRIDEKLQQLRGIVLPSDVELTVVRDYGDTAADKSNELLWHMLLAVLSVSALIGLVLGWREALVVLTAIPVTLALTLFVFYIYGYSLNRITLFALIFSIGILVDDAIVVVENMARHAHHHCREDGRILGRVAILAVNEVGNPTILATLTVVAAILPMAFVGGLMGPYMRPIPVGASAAMVFSLAVAFIVTPWAAIRLMRVSTSQAHQREDWLTARYRVLMGRVLSRTRWQLLFLGGVALLLVAAMALVPLGLVTVKMLPFDNKSEFQVIVNMPEGTALEDTARVTSRLADAALGDPEVTSVQAYAGAASPYNFNGLVRHYYLRQAPHQGDLQVNLRPRGERSVQSHPIAVAMRDRLAPLAARLGARIQVSEVPPGPPVLQTLVAEIYGPDESRRVELAQQVRDVFKRTRGVVDVDWYVEREQPRLALQVDTDRAAAAGIDAAHVAVAAALATGGDRVGLFHDATSREDVPVVLRLPAGTRRSSDILGGVYLRGAGGSAPLAALVRPSTDTEPRAIYHKNLAPVTYVIGDVARGAESPVYAILQMNQALEQFRLPEGYAFEIFSTHQPDDSTRYAMKWDGEWHITYEVFRDLGIAFAAVLILIYVLVVGWFQSFVTPLVIMAAIPFSLIGILPGHAALGAFFTATSMIGFIAGAGIVVRNSIILVDFIELRLRSGMAFQEAVIDAGAVRFRPMALTAAAVVVGSAVILFDPIFQGLAVSLMAGEVASLLLSRAAVPVMYHLLGSWRGHAPEGASS